MQRRSETMIARTSAETYENPKEKGHRNQSKESLSKKEHEELDTELDRELEDSFPASDPPSMTQPAPKPGDPHGSAPKANKPSDSLHEVFCKFGR
jgi:hypothetical protein